MHSTAGVGRCQSRASGSGSWRAQAETLVALGQAALKLHFVAFHRASPRAHSRFSRFVWRKHDGGWVNRGKFGTRSFTLPIALLNRQSKVSVATCAATRPRSCACRSLCRPGKQNEPIFFKRRVGRSRRCVLILHTASPKCASSHWRISCREGAAIGIAKIDPILARAIQSQPGR